MAAAAAARGAAGLLRRCAPRALSLPAPCAGLGPAPLQLRTTLSAPLRTPLQLRALHSVPLRAPHPLPAPLLLGGIRARVATPAVLSSVTPLLPSVFQQPARTLIYCSIRRGKRKSVKAVVKRFLRLHNGLWVRRKAGYKKRLWKKSASQRKRLREFVLCNRTQCKLLDKMTTSFWKRRNWYVDDPYQKYHNRTNLRV
ncbi:large ribosomal subunit protein bL35m [Pithys albifrons albifrons]|uniref:large ribosomal subunit protein bL35m n=1 Tax=Pithys albifrons albifrons TaxID=3385563 RepID=UPI003A5CD0B3